MDFNTVTMSFQAIFREIMLWWQLKHENILYLLGVCTWEEVFPSMVSPYMRNGSINKYMQSQKSLVDHVEQLKWVRNVLYFFPNSEVLINYRLQLSQLAKALVYLHEEFQPGPIVNLDVRCVC